MTLINTWTIQKLAKLGLWLTSAFGLSVNIPQAAAKSDTWTPDTLANFGLEMSKGFGTGL
ncbi:hypothetical protein IQ265_15120 [Nodosilinea sp. LEGE 06152]|uniref:hypothetical protein n=1 Tax=Nodosilinea sp. LEGE 06152 TaxID=2777966 RepID=UPI00187F363E|nr:hypothetical protein [Nodosilinea sp. LEGE 06152]MBE9158148.1 hypothetical protein [Nodosilinea sp. LEGE 06152]